MSSSDKENAKAYWAANVRLMVILLSIWFTVSFLCGIVFVDALNAIQIGGYKLGFWFAQQGSIYTFVALIFIYTRQMAKIDRQFGVHD